MADGAKKGPFAALRGAAAKPAAAKEETGLGKTRRRLSVVSDNKLVEGLSGLATEDATKATDSSAGDHVITSYAGVSKKGYAPYNPRKKNQDALIMEHHAETGSLLLCVFDGHGEAGDGVAQFFRNQMPPTLFAHPGFVGGVEEVKQAIAESTAFLERNLLRDSSIDTEFSGTTAVMCVIRGKDLIVGNIGDSRISKGTCAASADWKKGAVVATQVSDDHKPDRPDEKARILKEGGRVFAVEYDDGIDGPPRVWLGHMDVPGLAMARSLGDTVAHSAGVISDPEFTHTILTPEDKYLVIASDGLWEFMTDQEVLDIMHTQTEPRRSVDLLIMDANGRWMKEEQVIDDTTVIVAHLDVKA